MSMNIIKNLNYIKINSSEQSWTIQFKTNKTNIIPYIYSRLGEIALYSKFINTTKYK